MCCRCSGSCLELCLYWTFFTWTIAINTMITRKECMFQEIIAAQTFGIPSFIRTSPAGFSERCFCSCCMHFVSVMLECFGNQWTHAHDFNVFSRLLCILGSKWLVTRLANGDILLEGTLKAPWTMMPSNDKYNYSIDVYGWALCKLAVVAFALLWQVAAPLLLATRPFQPAWLVWDWLSGSWLVVLLMMSNGSGM